MKSNLSLEEVNSRIDKCMVFFNKNESDPLQLENVEKKLNEMEKQLQEIYSDLSYHFKQESNLVVLSLKYEDITNKRGRNFMNESIKNLQDKLDFYTETYGYIRRFSNEMNASEEKDKYVREMVEGLHRTVSKK